MKKLAIMQPYFMPHLGYFQLMDAVDEYVIYDDVQFIKGGWINRNNILISGRKSLFTIMLEGASPNKLINEIIIKDDFRKFKKSIEITYAKAPYREAVINLLGRICSYEDKNLSRFIGNSFKELALYLGIETRLTYSSRLRKDSSLRGQDKVISICKELGAQTYINSIGGVELYSKENFLSEGIELMFLKSLPVRYHQLGYDFVPGLSIIDVMMFNSRGEIAKMLRNYELV